MTDMQRTLDIHSPSSNDSHDQQERTSGHDEEREHGVAPGTCGKDDDESLKQGQSAPDSTSDRHLATPDSSNATSEDTAKALERLSVLVDKLERGDSHESSLHKTLLKDAMQRVLDTTGTTRQGMEFFKNPELEEDVRKSLRG